MGYAGYAPTKYVTEKTDLEKTLAAVSNVDSLKLLLKLTQNPQMQPREAKYRSIKKGNAKIANVLQSGGEAVLEAMGWENAEDESGNDVLVLPPNKQITMTEVRAVVEAVEKAEKDGKAKLMAAAMRAPTTDAEKERLRAQLEADRKERQAMEPSTGSIAKQLPGSGGITNCKDVGIGCSSGG